MNATATVTAVTPPAPRWEGLSELLRTVDSVRHLQDPLDVADLVLAAVRSVPGVSDLRWVSPLGIVRPPSPVIDEYLAALDSDLMTPPERLDRKVGSQSVTFIPVRFDLLFLGQIVILSDDPETFRPYKRFVDSVANMVATLFRGNIDDTDLEAHAKRLEAETDKHSADLLLKSVVLDTTASAVVIANWDGVIEWVNHAFVKAMGLELAEIIGQNPAALFKSSVLNAAAFSAMWESLAAGETWEGEIDHRRPDGVVLIYAVTVTPVRDEQGVGYKFVSVGQDITGQKRTETLLRESEARHRLLFDEMQEACSINEVITDADGRVVDFRILEANAAFERHMGMKPELVIGKTMSGLFPNAPPGQFALFGSVAQTGEALTYEFFSAVFHRHLRLRAFRGLAGQFVVMAEDITERHAAQVALAESEARHRLLFEEMYEGCSINEIITDADGRVIDIRTLEANAAYERHTGMKPERVIGKTLLEVFPDGDRTQIARYGAVAQTGEPMVLEYFSETFNRHLRARAFRGQPGQFVSMFEDITERKAEAVALAAAHKAADAASRAKSAFLHTVSHEIRTPLNGILGFTQLLQEEALAPTSMEYVDAIATSGVVLAQLIDDLLDLAKIEADRVVIEHYAFNVRSCIADAVRILQTRVEDKLLTLHLAVSSDVPSMLIGDGRRITQIVLNLVGNAVKFTERGGITVSVNVHEHDGDAMMVEILVVDSGIGMSAVALVGIFEPFTQAENSIARRFGGTGLGLSICRQLTDLMGGSLTCESAEGVGSTFRVLLPLRLAQDGVDAADTAPRGVQAIRWTGAPLKVLLVEDHQVNQKLGTALLRKLGHTVVLAADGAEALQVLEADPFDLVLMDIQMPVMDGLAALTILRTREAVTGAHTPVIAVTAFAMKGDAERFLSAGFAGYVSKPLQVQQLITEMQRVIAASAPITKALA